MRAIADNRCAELARWDEPALARLLEVIRSDDTIDTTATGFQEDEIDALVHEVLNSPNSDDDIIPDPPGRPITRRGDVWRLGEHRLLCGDSAKPQDVGQLFGNESADLCVTSPPYNVGLCYPCAKDRLPRDEYLAFIRGVAEQVFAVLKSGRFLAWNLGVSPTTHVGRQLVTLEEVGFRFYRQIIWAKAGIRFPIFPATQRARRARKYTPNYVHELIEVLQKPGRDAASKRRVECPLCDGAGRIPPVGIPCADTHETVQLLSKGNVEPGGAIHPLKKYSSDIWRIQQAMATRDLRTLSVRKLNFKSGPYRHAKKEHPATFPAELPRVVMAFLTSRHELVFDPFCGAGTTMIAAERFGRRCFGMEIDPVYCDITVRRWQKLTGRKARHHPKRKPARKRK